MIKYCCMSSKVIVHIDLNAFFARAEEIKDPSLENKPVVVGGDGRGGIVSTCSYKAREYGIHSAMPTFKAKQLCPDLIIKKVDYRFYTALSSRFISFIRRYTHLVEQVSVDECFADFTEQLKEVKEPVKYFLRLQQDLFKETGLKCSIGVAPTRFLAKMASDMKKPMGLTLLRKRDIKTKLYPLPIKDMLWIGKKTYPRLESIGVKTIGDLANALETNDEKVISMIGTFSEDLKKMLDGTSSNTIILEHEDAKSIGHSVTLSHDTDNYSEICEIYESVAKEVSNRAKMDDKYGTTIQILVKDTDFKVFQKSITFETPTNDWKFIYNKTIKLYEKNFMNKLIRQVGITLQNLKSPQDMKIQMSLFDYEKHESESSTKLLINDLNRKLKKPLLMRAAEVKNKK